MIAFVATVAALLSPAAAQAIEVERLDVRFREGRYIVEFQAQLDAPPDAVGAVLMDYERYPQLDGRIQESRRVDPADGSPPRLITKLRGCVATVICRSMRRVETLEQNDGEIIATAIPAESDVRYGRTLSRWSPKNDGTEVTYRLEIAPDFWVPALFARRAMIRTMRDGTLELFSNVERVARSKVHAP